MTWRPVRLYEGTYEVSDRGLVRRVGSAKPLKGMPTRDGHLRVSLWKGGIRTCAYVHHLVLEAFDRARMPGEEARHLTGDPTDNRIEALRWGTHSENELDKVRHGTHQKTRRTHCPRGHELKAPNLARSNEPTPHRRCLVCSRERGRRGDFNTDRADREYVALMGESA